MFTSSQLVCLLDCSARSSDGEAGCLQAALQCFAAALLARFQPLSSCTKEVT
jgi:hypothetical protein